MFAPYLLMCDSEPESLFVRVGPRDSPGFDRLSSKVGKTLAGTTVMVCHAIVI